jgi:hypothetical protein
VQNRRPGADELESCRQPTERRALVGGHATGSSVAQADRREAGRAVRDGRTALFFGMAFLIVINLVAELLHETFAGRFVSGVANGLEIFGWVALWHPAESLLCEWVPVFRRLRLMQRMSESDIECQAS